MGLNKLHLLLLGYGVWRSDLEYGQVDFIMASEGGTLPGFLLALHLRWDVHRAIQHLLYLLVSSLLCTCINVHFLEVSHVVLGPVLMTSPQLNSGNAISKQDRISHSQVSSLLLVPMFSYYFHIPLTLSNVT